MSLVSANKVETNTYELVVSVGAEDFKKGIDKIYKKTAKNITVPGFRKGKAPKSVIEKLYGEAVFYEDTVNDMYPDAYTKAVEEAGIDPVDRPEIEITDVSAEGFSFTAKVTVKPEVTVKKYKGLKATKTPVSVSDDQVDEEIAKLQERNGRMVTVEGRAAKDGDNTIIDFEGFVDDVPFEGGKGEKFDLKLGSGQFIPGFEEQIVGKNVGEEFDVNVTFPEDYQAEELAGKAAVFKCKLHEIKEKELPELDDEFAKDVSEFDTLDELKKDIRAKLTEAAEKSAETAVEEQLVEQVVESMEAEIPQCMVDRKTDEMLQEFDYRLQSQGLNLDLYMKYTGFSADTFKETYKEQALNQVKIRLALEEIVKLEKIEVTEEELNAEFEKMASAYSMDLEKIKELVPAEDIKLDLAVNKAIDLIKSSAEVSESAPEKKKAPAKKKAAAKEEKADEDGEKKAPAKKKTTKKKAEGTKDAE
ncbi:MAG: trigger factor [Oscillospiraceae bacterium]|nr:trigger factor [Oscillospiraceae bacterium]